MFAFAGRPLIRDFEPEDRDAILKLFRDTVRTVNRRDYSAEQVAAWAPDEPDRAAWTTRLAAGKVLVAVDEGAVLGFAQLLPAGFVDYFYVHAQRQRQGIGSALMARVLEMARADGMAELTAEVSITARPFFERQGFVVVTEQTVHRRGVDFVNFRMRRAL